MNEHIAVEGCIAAGKTTVASLLAKRRHSRVLLERFEMNPFLPVFYEDVEKYALETELGFLLVHYHQLVHLDAEKEAREVIRDFSFSKDMLFAELNLHNVEDLQLFASLYRSLSERLREPDLVVCLKCSDDLILDRIRTRNRDAEERVDPDYFVRLNHAYDGYFESLALPKLTVDMDQRDFLEDPNQVSFLSSQIDEALADQRQ